MAALKIVILIVAALATSALSGMLGMAGGILLLAIMFSVMDDATEVIPLHGAVQLVSNGTRALAFLPHVDFRTVVRFTLGTLPGIVIGYFLLQKFGKSPEAQPYLRMLIGAYILIATFLPKPKKAEQSRMTWYDFPLLGFVTGAAALLVGATGPLIAPLFARRDFVKERLVATKAMCQMVTHVEKLIVFGLIGIDFGRFGPILAAMIVAVIIGTYLGRAMIRKLSPELFVTLFKVALTLAGLKVLLIDGVWPLVKG
ncbi:MAG TPA: sulfite exporter TauE/SafE family protein [Phycisphaerae bacterium]|nr:sulfite exporter TauE/SafE family protein [Phycisphaerae bacterium]HRW54391.1 sulfite exporter TauE/SafE family protein [Phycisphaerae bacterium]